MLNISVSGIIFTVINLLVLYFALRHFFFKPVNDIMESRQKDIQDNIDAAQAQKAQAQEMKTSYEAQLAQADAQAAQVLSDAKARGQREYDAAMENARTDADRLAKQSQAQIAADREAMLKGARREVAQLALLAAGKVAGRDMSADDDRVFVDSFLSGAGDEA